MVLSNYINWGDLWDEEIDLKTDLDFIENEKYIRIINQFLNDDDVSLDFHECDCLINEYHNDDIIFMFNFSETGGQNESDIQGWYRSYWFSFKSTNSGDLEFMNCNYEQG